MIGNLELDSAISCYLSGAKKHQGVNGKLVCRFAVNFLSIEGDHNFCKSVQSK